MNVRALVGWNLRRLRVGRDLSQEALGLAADMEPSYIGRIERGRENATIETLDKLAALLREPISALFVVPPDGAKPPRALKSDPHAAAREVHRLINVDGGRGLL